MQKCLPLRGWPRASLAARRYPRLPPLLTHHKLFKAKPACIIRFLAREALQHFPSAAQAGEEGQLITLSSRTFRRGGTSAGSRGSQDATALGEGLRARGPDVAVAPKQPPATARARTRPQHQPGPWGAAASGISDVAGRRSSCSANCSMPVPLCPLPLQAAAGQGRAPPEHPRATTALSAAERREGKGREAPTSPEPLPAQSHPHRLCSEVIAGYYSTAVVKYRSLLFRQAFCVRQTPIISLLHPSTSPHRRELRRHRAGRGHSTGTSNRAVIFHAQCLSPGWV